MTALNCLIFKVLKQILFFLLMSLGVFAVFRVCFHIFCAWRPGVWVFEFL